MAGLLFWKKKRFVVGFERVQRGFLSEQEKAVPCRGADDGKGVGTNNEKSGARNLEPESIRSRTESTGGRVKLKTATAINHQGPMHVIQL